MNDLTPSTPLEPPSVEPITPQPTPSTVETLPEPAPPAKRQPPRLVPGLPRGMALFLWLAALATIVLAFFVFGPRLSTTGSGFTQALVAIPLSLGLALYLLVTGIGLWRRRAWGVLLFGLMALAALALNLYRLLPNLLQGDLLDFTNLLGELLFAASLIYLILQLRQAVRREKTPPNL